MCVTSNLSNVPNMHKNHLGGGFKMIFADPNIGMAYGIHSGAGYYMRQPSSKILVKSSTVMQVCFRQLWQRALHSEPWLNFRRCVTTSSTTSFARLGLHPSTLGKLTRVKIVRPTEIQVAAIPKMVDTAREPLAFFAPTGETTHSLLFSFTLGCFHS